MTDCSPPAPHRVYCAGPLFNQAERDEMTAIADILCEAGYVVYLPHRDGMEFRHVLGVTHAVPEFFRNERKEGMEEAEGVGQNEVYYRQGVGARHLLRSSRGNEALIFLRRLPR